MPYAIFSFIFLKIIFSVKLTLTKKASSTVIKYISFKFTKILTNLNCDIHIDHAYSLTWDPFLLPRGSKHCMPHNLPRTTCNGAISYLLIWIFHQKYLYCLSFGCSFQLVSNASTMTVIRWLPLSIYTVVWPAFFLFLLDYIISLISVLTSILFVTIAIVKQTMWHHIIPSIKAPGRIREFYIRE